MNATVEQMKEEISQRHTAIVALVQLWEIVIDSRSCPEQSQFSLWLDLHKFEHVAFGIREAGRKQLKRGAKLEPDHLARFVSSVCNRIKRETKEQARNTASVAVAA
jgi:hypothetical protein